MLRVSVLLFGLAIVVGVLGFGELAGPLSVPLMVVFFVLLAFAAVALAGDAWSAHKDEERHPRRIVLPRSDAERPAAGSPAEARARAPRR